MTDEEKKSIDGLTYEEMLRLWRFAPVGNKIFKGEHGAYFKEKMLEKKSRIPIGLAVLISKKVGW